MKYLFDNKTYHKVMDYLNDNLYRDERINQLLTYLESYGQIVLVGGSIKDIGFINKRPKDFDIIIKTDQKLNLNNLPSDFIIKPNIFGEPKVKYKEWIFDIMTAINKTEFREKAIQFNIDGLFINLSTGRYDARLYNHAIKSGFIEEVQPVRNHPNPNKTKQRMLKYASKLELKVQ